jgi:hypothetical protein
VDEGGPEACPPLRVQAQVVVDALDDDLTPTEPTREPPGLLGDSLQPGRGGFVAQLGDELREPLWGRPGERGPEERGETLGLDDDGAC